MSAEPNKERIAKIDQQRGKRQKRRGKGEWKSAVSGSALDDSALINISYWGANFDYYGKSLEVYALVTAGRGLIDDLDVDGWQTGDGSFLMDAHAFQLDPDVKTLFISATRELGSNPGQVLSFLSGVVTTSDGPRVFSYYNYLSVQQLAADEKAAGAR